MKQAFSYSLPAVRSPSHLSDKQITENNTEITL